MDALEAILGQPVILRTSFGRLLNSLACKEWNRRLAYREFFRGLVWIVRPRRDEIAD